MEGDEVKELPSLVYMGNKELHTPCEPFDVENLSSVQEQLEILRKCQTAYGGIGIAAPQVGWRTRIFEMGFCGEAVKKRYPKAEPFEHQFWINPVITPIAKSGTCWFWEGCLSVPGLRGWVGRPRAIHMEGYNQEGHCCRFSRLTAERIGLMAGPQQVLEIPHWGSFQMFRDKIE